MSARSPHGPRPLSADPHPDAEQTRCNNPSSGASGQEKCCATSDAQDLLRFPSAHGRFHSFADFLRATQPSQHRPGSCPHPSPRHNRKRRQDPAQNVAQSAAQDHGPESQTSAKTRPDAADAAARRDAKNVARPARTRKPRCTKAEKRQRLTVIAQFLVESASPQQIYEYARLKWGLSRRSVQLYIQEIHRQWADEASRLDYLAALWKSHQQHERALFVAFSKLKDADARTMANLLRIVERLLKARDRNLAELVEHRQLCRRDRSPDSASAERLEGGKVILDAQEFCERLHYLHEHWRKDLQAEFEALYGLRPRRDEAAGEPGQTQAPAGQTQAEPGQALSPAGQTQAELGQGQADPVRCAAVGDNRPASPGEEVEATGDGDLPGGDATGSGPPCGDAAGGGTPGSKVSGGNVPCGDAGGSGTPGGKVAGSDPAGGHAAGLGATAPPGQR
jgi:hypothetical protein